MLIDRNGRKQDLWTRGQPDQHDSALVAWEEWNSQTRPGTDRDRLGVEIPNTLGIEALRPVLSQVGLVAIRFASFSDGRGLSQARLIRRAGFTGVLRAVGPLIPDEFGFALQCGFDEVELPDSSANRQSEEDWLRTLAAYTHTYQQGYRSGTSILEQRRMTRAQKEAGHA